MIAKWSWKMAVIAAIIACGSPGEKAKAVVYPGEECQTQVCNLLPNRMIGPCNCSFAASVFTADWCFAAPDKNCTVADIMVKSACVGDCVNRPEDGCILGKPKCSNAVPMPKQGIDAQVID